MAEIIFDSGASTFAITVTPVNMFTISGTGITNNSGITQNFVADSVGFQNALMLFTNSATAGSNTSITNKAGTTSGNAGSTHFLNTSTAGSAAFTNNGAAVTGPSGGRTLFFDTSTAGSATVINNGGTASGASGGFTEFSSTSTAGSAIITNSGTTVGGAGSGSTTFSGSATAGSGTFTNNGATVVSGSGGVTRFRDTSTAGSATFTNNGGTVAAASGGSINFSNTSTAGNASFINNGGTVSGAGAGSIFFGNSSTAGSATFTNNAATVSGAGSGSTQFASTSTAGSATLIADGGTGNGGSIQFFENSTGGTASVDVRNNGTGTPGNLDISFHNAPGLTIGSLEGSGNVFLGANNLTVGSNNLSKTFSGVIQDGGPGGGTGGSLTKTGTGTLTLTGANTYSGDTTIVGGILVASASANLGNAGNQLVLDGGTLRTEASIVSTRKIAINAGGGTIDTNGFDSTFGDVSGPGTLVKNTGTLTVNHVRSGGLTINAGTVAIAPDGGADGTSKVNAVTIAAGAKLQMNDNDLIVDYAQGDPSPEFALRDHVKAILDGGATGIAFTIGAGDVALAIAEKTEWGQSVFNGFALDDTTVIGKYTYYGDSNLDGAVTSDDYVAVDVGLGTGDSWVQGDFNFSGSVTSDDYVAIYVNLGKGTPTPLAWAELKADMIALHTAMFGAEYVEKLAYAEANGFGATLVPEPGALGLVGLGAARLLGRRGRRR